MTITGNTGRTQKRSSRPVDAKPSPPSGPRLDIQGLRAFAVLVVIIDHLTGWPGGGFAGVDVFFVISGFLITTHLVTSYEKNGRISAADFYRRRIVRIIPAAVTCLLVTVVVAKLVFLDDRWRTTVTDAIYAFFFAANWRFKSQATDYFAQDGPKSPFQHYWSLSIEEQFYFVWPWLMLLVFVLLLRGRSQRVHRQVALALIGAISVASFAYAMAQTGSSPGGAYFSTLTRVWELGAGAMLAIAAPLLLRIPDRIRPALAWVGAAAMFYGLWAITPDSAVPAPAMALPVGAAALFIAAGTREGQQPFLGLYTNPVSVYLGDISYSLYLWHFPVIILLGAGIGDGSALFYILAVALITVVSVTSYHLVEDPIRKSPWLSSWSGRRISRSAWSDWRFTYGYRYSRSGLAIGVAVATTLAALSVFVRPEPPSTAEALTFDPPQSGLFEPVQEAGVTYFSAQEKQLEDAVEKALRADSWPTNLNPALDDVEAAAAPEEQFQGCGHTDLADPASCSFGDPAASPHMVVYGDSTGITLIPTVRAAYGDQYYIRGVTSAGCTVLVTKSELPDGCAEHNAEAIDWVKQDKPDVLILITTSSVLLPGDIREGDAYSTAYQEGTSKVLDQLASSAKSTIVVSAPPSGTSVQDCATKLSHPGDCVDDVPIQYDLAGQGEQAAVARAGKSVHYYDTLNWFCSYDDRCPPFIGNTITQRDPLHTTKQWAVEVAPLFKARLEQWLSPGR